MRIDITNLYINTTLSRFEYLKLKLADDKVIAEYMLSEKATTDGRTYDK